MLPGDRRHRASAPGEDDPAGRSAELVFLHIPKTAGTSMIDALRPPPPPAGAPPDILRGYDRSVFGTFDGFETLSASLRDEIALSTGEMPSARLVAGHYAFSTLRQAYPGVPAMTVLRDGRSRALSHWLYWRQTSDRDLAPWGGWGDRVRRARGRLGEFLRDPVLACQTDNPATRMLLWPHPAIEPDRFIPASLDRRLFRVALARLRTLDFVDLLENRDLYRRASAWLGRPVASRRHNVTPSMPAGLRANLAEEFDPGTVRALAARSRLDDRLWRHVAARRMRGVDLDGLRERTLLANVARYGALMA